MKHFFFNDLTHLNGEVDSVNPTETELAKIDGSPEGGLKWGPTWDLLIKLAGYSSLD